MQMLVEEILNLLFVDIAHGLRGNGHFVAVLVLAFQGEGVDGGHVGVVVGEDAQGAEVV